MPDAPSASPASSLTIWVVNPFDDIPGEGLPPIRFWSLSKALAERGHDVTWWTASWSHRRKATRTLPAGVKEAEGFGMQLVDVRPYMRNVSLARIASHRDFGAGFERRANELVATGSLRRPDVILASLPPLDSPEAAIRLARRHAAACIIDIMDLWPETFERLLPGPTFLRRLASPLLLGRMRTRRRAIVAGADAVSAATHTYLSTTLADAGVERPSHVCYLGARLPEQPHESATPAPGDAQRPLACVYAGTLEMGQDLETLVAAARRLASSTEPVTLHVAGTGRLEPMLRAAAPTIGGACELRVHGLLAKPEYEKLLGQCDVGLVLVKPESCVAVPYKACDYAAAGLALVNSLPGELQTLIDEHGAGLAYTAGDAESLAASITKLAQDRRGVAIMRTGSRRLAAAAFDREHTYPRFAAWIEARSRGPRRT
jgi:glycosyltransferase involved in cell wall biosynthesis